MTFIPVNEPLLDGNEKDYLVQCIDTGWISSEGPFVHRFENEFSSRHGMSHGIAVSSGSAALDIAVAALGIGIGDEVIVPTFTIISCVASIVRAGAKPVLVDSELDIWNMDVGAIESEINGNTKAIMVVHIYGLPVDMKPVIELAKKHGLFIIEDAAEAIGQSYFGKPCGSFGDISVFSFYPNKHVTTGEGGMLLTNDEDLAERCRSFRNLCFQKEKRFYHHELGWNYRMSNVQAALGVAQLERLDSSIYRKREIGAIYNSQLSDLEQIKLPVSKTEYAENVYWVYGLVVTEHVPIDAEALIKRLAAKGVGTRPFFWPMHEQPVFQKMGLFQGEEYPVSENLARRGLYLPSGLALTNDQILHVCDSVKKCLT